MSFEPIAIVGAGCVLPGALSPDALWERVVRGDQLLSHVPAGRWGLEPELALGTPAHSGDRSWSDVGGYVTGFDAAWDPRGFGVPEGLLSRLGDLYRWPLHAGRQALEGVQPVDPSRAAVVLGNLSFPSGGLSRFAERVWLGDNGPDWARVADELGLPDPAPVERFMSGLPAHLLADAFGFRGEAFALDAACASALYAVASGCDALQAGRADLVLAGAVNQADDLFIHVGFCALSAMSKTGQSRPFHREADGLVPAEGCAIVALKRLSDAVAAGDKVLGVIRGIGLANDGRGRGLLAPSSEGQLRAMRQAYARSGWSTDQVGYVECHATGTIVGDATEIESMAELFGAHRPAIGSLKGNLGHLITAAGGAGLIKVLWAQRHGLIPPTPGAEGASEAVVSRGFAPVGSAAPWAGDRRAAVSAFGFGGNNAHLLVEPYDGRAPARQAPLAPVRLAVVGMGAIVGNSADVAAWSAARRDGSHQPGALPLQFEQTGVRVPPADLKDALPQQLFLLQAAREAVERRPLALPRDKTAVVVGMGCDPEVARYGARWRAGGWLRRLGAEDQVPAVRDAFVALLKAPGVLGTMPNIPANRLNGQFDVAGPSLVVSGEENSGLEALAVASDGLSRGDLDLAIVGAVDLSVEPVHQAAARAVLPPDRQLAGDAAVVLLIKRHDDAVRDGDPVWAILDPDDGAPRPVVGLITGAPSSSPGAGHAHAARGLVELAGAILAQQAGEVGEVLVQSTTFSGRTRKVLVRPGDRVAIASPKAPQNPRVVLPHLPPVRLPRLEKSLSANAVQTMAPAPRLVPVADDRPHHYTPVFAQAPVAPAIHVSAPAPLPMVHAQAPYGGELVDGHSAQILRQQALIGAVHREFLAASAAMHQQFLAGRLQALAALSQGWGPGPSAHAWGPAAPAWSPAAPAPAVEAYAPAPVAAPQAPAAQPPRAEPATVAPVAKAPAPAPVPTPPSVPPALPPKAPVATRTPEVAPVAGLVIAAAPPEPVGLSLSREQLEVHAGGKISEIYGAMFRQQDGYLRQTRMPEPPLLLADRVTGIDGDPGSMKKGTIWTETDVKADSWYLLDGYMPPGIMIESGQADLMLISWLGIDFTNKSERIYRLLGCDLTYHDRLPAIGDTLKYDIHVDGHAKHGDVRLFFFHYDCRVEGSPRLSVRNGQAGFFTDQELADSAGILWTPEEGEHDAQARLDGPAVANVPSRYSREQTESFARGDGFATFGAGYEWLQTHNRPPRIHAGKLNFLHEVTELTVDGGPWKRGYLRAVQKFTPDDWFFDGHFKNDPCMPGTLMFDGCLQAMAFYLAALGYTLRADGWRFEPVTGHTIPLRCRGQVTPTTKELVYEIFVEEVHDGPVPTLYADLLCTADGLKAFHARRMGLRLVPDWPMTSMPYLLDGHVETKEVAQADGFKFDYRSLMACAWGRPSEAFGPMYKPFDGHRKVARLPGPPYHFMSRVTRNDGPIGVVKAGAVIELEYDVPPEAWYFRENGNPTMPWCVFLEAALQPCGWLASYVGSALTTEQDLLFRNLDGTATWKVELLPTSGTLRTVVKITNISISGGMIIESFEVKCYVGEVEVYEMKTVFGFFPKAAFENQVGIVPSDDERAMIMAPPSFSVDLQARPPKYCEGALRLPGPMLLMLDRVVEFSTTGGAHGKGRARAEKTVDPGEWFFKAHFFQDAVQPGSLGLEALVQLAQFWVLESGVAEGIEAPRFEPLAMGLATTWKYRGQVTPKNKTIRSEIDVVSVERDDKGLLVVVEGYLWVDHLRIYQSKNVGIRVTSGAPDPRLPAPPETVVLDPATDAWIGDHCPTWTLPALPAMWMVDALAREAVAREPWRRVVGLRDVQIHRWVVATGPTSLQTRRQDGRSTLSVWREARKAELSRFEPACSGIVDLADSWPEAPPVPPEDGRSKLLPDPYRTGRLFHGPSFRHLKEWRARGTRYTALLDAANLGVPHGVLNPGLLDAVTHAIPHDSLWQVDPRIGKDLAAYPYKIPEIRFFGDAPRGGQLRVEATFAGFDGDDRLPMWDIWVGDHRKTWCTLRLVEILVPKGPIGSAPPEDRLAFLNGAFVAGLGLAQADGQETVLPLPALTVTDWLPGTVARAYDADPARLAEEVATKDHLARKTLVHPRAFRIEEDGVVSDSLPLNRFQVQTRSEGDRVVARDGSPAEILDITPIREWWSHWFGLGQWPVEDLYYGLVERFVRRVVVTDPAAMAAVKGKSVVYLANHQTGVESLLFSIIASGLNQVPTVTLAKAEHRSTWLGTLIAHCFQYPGCQDPMVIAFFDREDKASLPTIINDLARQMTLPGGRSVMVHVEGTRATHARHPVEKMSTAFIDLALSTGSTVVPVRFVGGLPVEPVEKRLEFPLGMGRQDVWIGRPLSDADFAGVPYRERKRTVLQAINALGPAAGEETPLPGNPAFAALVRDWIKRTGVDEEHAVLFQTLGHLPDPSDEVKRIVEGARIGTLRLGDNAKDRWIGELARRLFGPNGPKIA